MMKKVKYLIVGAGISGLTFANYVKNDYLIIEKSDRIGGYCKTTRRNGYVWDYAGHFFHFNNEEFKKMFEDNYKADELVNKNKCTKIYYKGELIDYPFQTNIHQLEKQEFIDCLYDLFNKEEKENYDNFLDMLYGKFGKSITEKFLKPYNEKLYAVDLKSLDTNAMGRFFPYANKEEIINNMKSEYNSYNSTFLYPKRGAESFLEILYSKIDKEKVLFNTEVVKIDTDKKIVTLSNKEEYEYEYLINSIPLNVFLPLVDNGKYNELKNELSYNQVLVFNLGFDKKSTYDKEHWLYIPDKNINFYRVGFYDNILGTDKLSMYIEIGFNKDDKIDVSKELEKTLLGLKEMNIIDDSYNLVDYETIIMNPAYVHITENTDKKITKLKEDFETKGVYTIGRYGGWTYCSMEDCMVEAKNLSEKIEKENK